MKDSKVFLYMCDIIPYIQDDLLARIIFGKFVCEKQLAAFILAIRATIPFFSSFFVAIWACLHSY